jgi:hypothetical protein
MQYVTQTSFPDRLNRRIVQSEVEGGVYLNDQLAGARLAVETRNRVYLVDCLAAGEAMISGHPQFCPVPVRVSVHGSTWGGSMLKARFVGRGMHLEFEHPEHRTIVTSPILEIRMVHPPA